MFILLLVVFLCLFLVSLLTTFVLSYGGGLVDFCGHFEEWLISDPITVKVSLIFI